MRIRMVVLCGPSSRFALRRDPFNVKRSQDRSPRRKIGQDKRVVRLSLIWPGDPRRYCLSHKLVPEPCAVGLDEPRRRMWEMDRQNIFAGPGDLGEKPS